MNHHDDHGPPIPTEDANEFVEAQNPCKIGLPYDHTHEHSGWTKWRPLAVFGVLLFAASLAFWIGFGQLREHSDSIEALAKANRKTLERTVAQSEENCKARDEQLRQAAARDAASRKFLIDVGERLRADGNLLTYRFIQNNLRERQPIKPPPPTNCDFSEALSEG